MPNGKGRVLLAEDEALIAMMLEDALSAAGYKVTVATNGELAFQAAGEAVFDALVTDLNMPLLSGGDLIARLRVARPDLPVVVLTGNPPPTGAEALRRPGEASVALLVKPVDGDELVVAVDAAFRHAETGNA